ncbi:hypothetical protein ACLOJK_007082 [Asimina triloba]
MRIPGHSLLLIGTDSYCLFGRIVAVVTSLDAPFARLFVWDLFALIGSREMWSRVPEFLAYYPIRCWLSAQAAPLIAEAAVESAARGRSIWGCCLVASCSLDLEVRMLLDGLGMLFGAAVMDVIEPGDLGPMDDRVAAHDGFPLGFAGSDELAAADWAEKKMMGSAAGKKTAIEDR